MEDNVHFSHIIVQIDLTKTSWKDTVRLLADIAVSVSLLRV